MGKLSAVGEYFVNLHKLDGLLGTENGTGDRLEGELGPPKTPPSYSAWPITIPCLLSTIFTGMSGSYGLKTTPTTLVTDLKVTMDLQRLHHCTQRGR